MAKDLAVLIVHGMGSQQPGFAIDMIDELCDRLGDAAEQVAWKSVYWQDILESRQQEFLRRAKRHPNDLDYVKLRAFIVSAIGDAAAYQNVTGSHNTYEQIHKRVGEKVADLYVNDLNSKAVPLVVMAHSLGAHIMSNYIWDMQKKHTGAGLSDFEQMKTHAGMITFGCNIPLFSFAHEKVVPIKFPGTKLSPILKDKAQWLNYYDPDDVLGYPLRPINDAYKKVVTRDIAINVGGLFTSWNPMSHSGYWTDNSFTKPVAKFLNGLLG